MKQNAHDGQPAERHDQCPSCGRMLSWSNRFRMYNGLWRRPVRPCANCGVSLRYSRMIYAQNAGWLGFIAAAVASIVQRETIVWPVLMAVFAVFAFCAALGTRIEVVADDGRQ